MSIELRLARAELYPTGTLYKSPQLLKRNLGSAIFLAAIEDYRSMCDELHETAERFLYPRTPAWQDQYDWAVALSRRTGPGMAAGCARSIARQVGWTAICQRTLDDTRRRETMREREGDHQ